MENSILVITYFYSVKGCCPAEWADDKLSVIEEDYEKVFLITGLSSNKNTAANVNHYRVPSLSIIDLKHEINDLKLENRKIPYFNLALLLPFILTIGLFLDLLQKIFISGNGGGKWSWALTASMCALYVSIRHKCKLIFTTGGPASAHLAGVFASFFTRGNLICELQDPMTGDCIGRNSRSAMLLGFSEMLIVNKANKVVYVTNAAANYARNKYNNCKSKIACIYPGSRVFSQPTKKRLNENKKISMIHLGTLYSTRNLNSLITAIDDLINEGQIESNQIEIVNLGEIYGEIREHHISRSYISQLNIKPRQEAIEFASTFMISLLVQHSDPRSEVTIPYKTYDYINIGNPIFGLTKSKELSNLLIENGHLAVDINNVLEIKKAILHLINKYEEHSNKLKNKPFEISQQTKKILEL